jgi:hypothetical protein
LSSINRRWATTLLFAVRASAEAPVDAPVHRAVVHETSDMLVARSIGSSETRRAALVAVVGGERAAANI